MYLWIAPDGMSTNPVDNVVLFNNYWHVLGLRPDGDLANFITAGAAGGMANIDVLYALNDVCRLTHPGELLWLPDILV